MDQVFRHAAKTAFTEAESQSLINTEWLVTNGLGGYAAGTIGGVVTRGFHGYLIAALPSPLGRTMMLNDIVETLQLPGGHEVQLGGEERANAPEVFHGSYYLTEFRLQWGIPVWTYQVNGLTIEKRVLLPHGQNTTFINYRVTGGSGSALLQLRPSINMHLHQAPVSTALNLPYTLNVTGQRYEVRCSGDLPPLRLLMVGESGELTIDSTRIEEIVYRIEQSRGYAARGDLWSPGYLSAEICLGRDATLVASAEAWEIAAALSPDEAWDAEVERKRRLLLESHPQACGEVCRDLIMAADQFLIRPVGRQRDTTRARAAGDEVRTVIAGYHWFTDWGRDTMIGLEGLTLCTGRHVEAGYILRTFAHYIRDGLIPNMFPEGENDGLYHTADATLWFFHALHRYLHVSNDRHFLGQILPKLLDIVGHHLRGTKFGIHVDPADGLLVQGQEGYQLTWMDAKVGDWVVTPRRGKAVEINALWYNALRLLEGWLEHEGQSDEAAGIRGHADKAQASFNRRFPNPATGYLFDVVDGQDPEMDAACRPNQLFGLSLDHPVLDAAHWEPVVSAAKEKLFTPVGLRSLAPGSKHYKSAYDGDLVSRDAAYHQGTVWAWLIGPFIDAWLRVYPDEWSTARGFLKGFGTHLLEDCVGSISEIFDAEAPFTPRGCVAQAWSVAEVLRCYIKTSGRQQQG